MTAHNRNELWGAALVDELARAGVRHLVVSPGSRSAPVLLAAAADLRFRIHVQIDERCAGFVALGVAKGTGTPAAVLTTSGTAVANLFPSVVEASQSEVPVIVLTADRPPRLRGADANQTIDQVRIFGGYVRRFDEVSPAEASESALRHLRSVVSRAMYAAMGEPAGPVHLNLAFDKPLEPTPSPGDLDASLAERESPASRGRPEEAPWTRIFPRRAGAGEALVGRAAAALREARRPLLVAGVAPRPWESGPALRRLAAAWRIPILADPLSGARYPCEAEARGSEAFVIGAYDLALRDATVRARLQPDLVLRVGATPTSGVLSEWLSELDGVSHIVVDGGGRWKDHDGVATTLIPADPTACAHSLVERAPDGESDGAWPAAWRALETATRREIAAACVCGEPDRDGAGIFEGAAVAEVARCAEANGILFVSSSMPVRDLDTFVPHRETPLTALGNRGASGIDGIVSTAAGVSLATGRRVIAIVGDLALLHDSNGLASLRDPAVRVVIVVLNNDGGGIFHFLPVHDFEPAFTPYFATPHGRAFARLAEFHGLPHLYVEGRGVDVASSSSAELRGLAGVRESLERSLSTDGSALLEIRTDREVNRRTRTEVADRVATVAAAAPTDGHR